MSLLFVFIALLFAISFIVVVRLNIANNQNEAFEILTLMPHAHA